MIRLYVDQNFQVGESVKIPKEEKHYWQSVRRGSGEVELFNRQGQTARGRVISSHFEIEEVEVNQTPLLDLGIALAIPDPKVLREVVFSLSEMGVARLRLFLSERSQLASSRLPALHLKVERWALESARQCCRPGFLEIEWLSFNAAVDACAAESLCWVMEELPPVSGPNKTADSSSQKPGWMFVGCEGGWTPAEREAFQEHSFQFRHLPCPILKVHTACVAAASYILWNRSDADGN